MNLAVGYFHEENDRFITRIADLEKALNEILRTAATVRGDQCGGNMHPFAAEYRVSARAVDAARSLMER
jgi:hypothetical protein